MFCAGRVTEEDLNRTMKACGGSIQTTVHDLSDATLGLCETFEEKQVTLNSFNGMINLTVVKSLLLCALCRG